MKKFFITIGVLLTMFFACNTALAADITIATEPAQVTAAGSVTIKITIRNDSQYAMTRIGVVGLGINNPENVYSLTIEPGATRILSIPSVGINEDMLGRPQTFSFTWTEGTEQKSQEASLTIGEQQQTAAAMTATRKASKSSGKEGDVITLTYTLKNPSTVSMTDVTLTDALAGTSAIEAPFTLEAGGTKTITYDYTLGREDAVSQPTVTYKVSGETKTLTIDPETIKITNVSLQAAVTQNEPTTEGTLFNIALKNDGNQDISEISVVDELGNKVNQDKFTLKAGEEKLLTFMVQTDSVRNVAFVITGKDALGQPYENKTKSLEARPYVDPSNVKFTMFVTVPEPLSESGRMKVRFTIQNDSTVEITNATITEAELGELERRDALPTGETVIEKDLRISEPRELQFTLTAYDPSGTARTYQAQVPATYMPATTPDPEQTFEVLDPDDIDQPAEGNDTLITVLIVLAVLMGVAGIALLVLSIYERKKSGAMPDYETDGGDLPSAPVRGDRAKARRQPTSEDAEDAPVRRNEPPVRRQQPPAQQQPSNAVRKRPESQPPRPRQAVTREEKYEPPQQRTVQRPQQYVRPDAAQEPPRNSFAQRSRVRPDVDEPVRTYSREPQQEPTRPAYNNQQPFIPGQQEPPPRPTPWEEPTQEEFRRPQGNAPRTAPAQEPHKPAYSPRPAEPEEGPAEARPTKSASPSVRNRVHRVRSGDDE